MALKIGDKVTVYRSSKESYWIPEMDKLVGQSGIINLHPAVVGGSNGSFFIDFGNDNFWFIPKASVKRTK